jgi:GAF domain-containing protein
MDAIPRGPALNGRAAEALAELTNLMLATPSVDTLMDEVARLAAQVVTPPAHCGITLRRDQEPFTVAASGPLASRVDEVQYGEGDGPCLQTMRTGEAVAVTDLVGERRWHSYPGHALRYGVRSSLSLPLSSDDGTRGALNLYATVPDAFGDRQRKAAELFAAQASAALSIVTRMAGQIALTGQLREALRSRSVIDQAIGIIMGEQRCDADEAFGLLRSASQHQNRRLRDLAADVVRNVGGREPRPSPFHEPA